MSAAIYVSITMSRWTPDKLTIAALSPLYHRNVFGQPDEIFCHHCLTMNQVDSADRWRGQDRCQQGKVH